MANSQQKNHPNERMNTTAVLRDGVAAAVAEEPVAAPLVRKTPIGADLFTQLGGAFLVLLAVMAAPSFSGQMACVAASVVGYQLRALQAFFGPSN